MPTILDHTGRPIEKAVYKESQTSRVSQLRQEFATHPVRGLTPAKLAQVMEAAEQGDITQQSDLFLDFEERDPHLHAEMGKRRRALLGLEWRIEPPRNATPAEEKATQELAEIVDDLPDLEDMILDCLDAVGHGFAALEVTWAQQEKLWLPTKFEHRPQSWFKLDKDTRTQLRLRDGSMDGAEPWPFGWVIHLHRAKSGYIARTGLYRVLAWPWVFKQYAVRDLAEFLEVYGLPAKVGKYPVGADDNEKATLYQAVRELGRLAAGIMPESMRIEYLAAADGAADPFMAMMEYNDRAISKAVLGQTLSADAQPTGLGSGLATLHGDVRRDLLISDAKQLAGTLTRQILYPIAALNGKADSPARAPRWAWDLSESEDLAVFADGVQKLVASGVQIPVKWVRERAGIPPPEDGDEIIGGAASAGPSPATPARQGATRLAAAAQGGDAPDYPDAQAARLETLAEPMIAAMLGHIRRELDQAPSLAAFRSRLEGLYPELAHEDLTELLGRAFTATHLAGRYDVNEGD